MNKSLLEIIANNIKEGDFITWYRNEEYYKSGDWRGKLETEGGVFMNLCLRISHMLRIYLHPFILQGYC